ncbi:MAG: hypothetical protein ACYCPP_08230 [Nitrososphaerales archaeon]
MSSINRCKSSLLNLMVKQGLALRLNVGPYKRAFIGFKKPT